MPIKGDHSAATFKGQGMGGEKRSGPHMVAAAVAARYGRLFDEAVRGSA